MSARVVYTTEERQARKVRECRCPNPLVFHVNEDRPNRDPRFRGLTGVMMNSPPASWGHGTKKSSRPWEGDGTEARTRKESIGSARSVGPWGGGKHGGRLGGPECLRCGYPPPSPAIGDLVRYAERLGIGMNRHQAREWVARCGGNRTAAFHALTRLAEAAARRNQTTEPLALVPPLSEKHLKLRTARAVDAKGLAKWIEDSGLRLPRKYKNAPQRWRTGATAHIHAVDEVLTAMGLHLSDLPTELLLDKLPAPRSRTERRVQIEEHAA